MPVITPSSPVKTSSLVATPTVSSAGSIQVVTQQAHGVTAVGADVVGNPNASAATPPPVRQVSGLPRGFDANDYGSKNCKTAASDGLSGQYIARPKAGSFTGYGDITKVVATRDGFSIDVDVYTQAQENVCLLLQLPLLDKQSGELTYLNLDVLTNHGQGQFTENIPASQVTDPVSGQEGVWGGRRTYAFSLQQINTHLKNIGIDVEVKPGDQLSVSGLAEESGHRVMNPVSNAFIVPCPLAEDDRTTSPTGARINNVANQVVKAESLPLDITVKLPKWVLEESFYFCGKYLTVGRLIEGDITTRLESEYKGSVTEPQMNAMMDHAYQLAELSEKALNGDKKARKLLDGLLGEGVVLTPVKRHWITEDGTPLGDRDPDRVTFKRDAQGRPCLDGMKDSYSDDRDLTFAQHSGAVRVRDNAQKAGHAEFKLTGGRLDPKTGIRQRVETGITLKPRTTEDGLKTLLGYIKENPDSKLGTSPLGHIVREAMKVGLADSLVTNRTTWANVEQVRHKFELKNTLTGTSAELSLDTVHAQTTRPIHRVDGTPQERTFYVIETELDHLQINSANVTQMQQTTSRQALLDSNDQQMWVNGVKAGKRKFEVLTQPQLHGLDHVEEGSFRQTASYKQFETMHDRLLNALCDGFRPGPARQKSAHFAELLGLIGPEGSPVVKTPRTVV